VLGCANAVVRIYQSILVLTFDNPMQNDALAAKDGELEQASAALASKVCLVYLRMSGLTGRDWTNKPARAGRGLSCHEC
jgi:hypothetical protein